MRKSLLMLVFTLLAGAAQATFHLWSMGELYSNGDGTVQFLEIRALTGGQQFMTGHSLRSTPTGGAPQDFEFANGLPGDSTNRTMLIGTQGYAALSGVPRPDYIVPNGFFGRNGGRIVFAENADVWDHGPLPAAPLSLDRNGSTATNSPRNFAGDQGSVTLSAPASFNVHGLWWNDPDNSEPGWGVNLSHHGNIVFLSWFTYDTDGSGMWLFMSNAQQTAANTYAGQLFRSTGARFDAYDRTQFAAPAVGTGTLTFSDAGHGTFAYTVNGISQTKNIKRIFFGTQPTCDQSGAAATNFTDLYGLDTEPGWGINVVQQDNIIFLSWFTYGADGKGMWMFASNLARTTGNTFAGQLFRSTGPAFNSTPWNVSQFNAPAVGTATLAFTSASTATFSYTVGSVTQTKNVARNVHALPATTCR
jgi:hypothetical protein